MKVSASKMAICLKSNELYEVRVPSNKKEMVCLMNAILISCDKDCNNCHAI